MNVQIQSQQNSQLKLDNKMNNLHSQYQNGNLDYETYSAAYENYTTEREGLNLNFSQSDLDLYDEVSLFSETQSEVENVVPGFFETQSDYVESNNKIKTQTDDLFTSGVLTETPLWGDNTGKVNKYNIQTQSDIDEASITGTALTLGFWDGGEGDRASLKARVIGEGINLATTFGTGFVVGKALSSGKKIVTVGGKVVKGAKILSNGKVVNSAGKALKGAKVVFQPTRIGKLSNKILTSKPVRLASEGWTGEVHDIAAGGLDQFTEIRDDIKDGNYGQAAGHMAYGYAKEKVGDKLTGAGAQAGFTKTISPSGIKSIDTDAILRSHGSSIDSNGGGDARIARLWEIAPKSNFEMTKPKTWTLEGWSKTTGIDFGFFRV